MAPLSKFAKLFAGGRPTFPTAVAFGKSVRDIVAYQSVQQHPGYGVTPASIFQIFRQAELGDPSVQCDLFDDMVENDAHLRNLFEQRTQAVSGKPWVVQTGDQGDDADLVARVLREAFRRLPVVDVFEHLLSFNRYGFACAEIEWGLMSFEGRDWVVPVWLHAVSARRFRIDPITDQLRIFVDAARPKGDALDPWKWVVLRRSGSQIARSALTRTAAWPAMAKRYAFRDSIIFSERFGLPFPSIAYKTDGPGAGADGEAIDVATEILKNIGNDSGAVHPDTIKIEFAEVGQSGDSSKVHGALISFANREMSKLVNGSTLSNDNSDSGGASYALGDVHAGVRWEAVQYDAEKLQSSIEQQIFTPFCAFNAMPAVRTELRIQVVRNLEPGARVELAAKMVNELGIKISIGQLRSDTGFRAPTDDDDSAPGKVIAAPVVPAARPKEAA